MEASEQQQRAKALWASGNYEKVGAHFGPAAAAALKAAGVGPGDRVLDVACGTGNATIPAAQAGAKVTGLDLTPKLLEIAGAAAQEAGVEIDFVQGDAGAMPFDDGSFDRVISTFGCMFVPDHKTAAAELVRVLDNDGTFAALGWTPGGVNGTMFRVISGHMPAPPEGFQSPILWGDEDHMREVFEGTGVDVSFERGVVPQTFDSVDEVMSWIENDVPPTVAARAALEPDGKWEPLRDELRDMYEQSATLNDDGSTTLNAEFLVTKGHKVAKP
jgi:ubiquinone/menaquinone biosynthesis C-methylase UbiE